MPFVACVVWPALVCSSYLQLVIAIYRCVASTHALVVARALHEARSVRPPPVFPQRQLATSRPTRGPAHFEQPFLGAMAAVYPTVESTVGNTPLVRLQRLGTKQIAARNNVVLCKLEGAAPAHTCAHPFHAPHAHPFTHPRTAVVEPAVIPHVIEDSDAPGVRRQQPCGQRQGPASAVHDHRGGA